jgi:protein TonB
MNTIKASFDDLVFRARNKSYGAYVLRKKLGRHTLGGFIFGALLVTLFFSLPILIKYLEGSEEQTKQEVDMTDVKLSEPPPLKKEDEKEKEVKKKEVVEPPPPKRDQVKYTEPEVKKAEDIENKDQEITNLDTVSRDVEFAEKSAKGTGEGPPTFTEGVGEGPRDSDVKRGFKPKKKKEKAKDIFALSNEPKAVNMDQIKGEIEYPEIARESGISGTVILEVYIDKRGRYKKHKVVRSPHKLLTKECEKHIANLRFQPGIQGGNPVPFKVQVPFNFKIDR